MTVSFLLWFPHFVYVPILSPYMESIDGTYSFIGIVLSSYGLLQLLCRLPIGILSDLMNNRKPFIVLGMLMSFFSCMIYLLTENLWMILVARSLAGIAASSWVAFSVLFPSYYGEQEVHKAMGSISFIVVLAQFLGMSFSGYIVEEWGWQAPFVIGASFSFIGMVLSFFITERKVTVEREPMKLKDLTLVIKEPALLKISFISILAHSIIFSTMFGFTSNYAINIGFSPSELTWIVFAFMIPHASATLFIGSVLVPRLGEWRSLRLAFLFSSLTTIVIPFIGSKMIFLIVQGLNGFFLGLIFPVLLGLSIDKIAKEKRATAMGTYQALYATGIFVGPFFAGYFNSLFGIQAGFYFVGLLGLVATCFVVIWGEGFDKQSVTDGLVVRKEQKRKSNVHL
jgi:MFS transporter, DHA1 family, multidrug resistance protein